MLLQFLKEKLLTALNLDQRNYTEMTVDRIIFGEWNNSQVKKIEELNNLKTIPVLVALFPTQTHKDSPWNENGKLI
jgi:hypothetical protein